MLREYGHLPNSYCFSSVTMGVELLAQGSIQNSNINGRLLLDETVAFNYVIIARVHP